MRMKLYLVLSVSFNILCIIRIYLYLDYSLSTFKVLVGIKYSFDQSQSLYEDRSIMIKTNSTNHCACEERPIVEKKKYDVTFVSQTSMTRLFYMKYLTNRWHGPFSITVTYENDEQDSIKQYMEYPSVHYTTYKTNSSYYPINKLRNIAINNIKTTHFFLSDMDFWPSNNVYESFLSFSDYLIQDEWLAVIVPGFQYIKKVLVYPEFQPFVESIADQVPSTKEELRECLKQKKCQKFRPETKTHSYHYARWIDEPKTKSLVMLEKFKFRVQEPYVIIQKTDHMPLFSELFYNYGRNKVQWIEHLRYVGYKFGVMAQGYGIDVPHPPSHFQEDWAKKGKEGKLPFVDVYDKFVTELYKQPDRSIVYVEK